VKNRHPTMDRVKKSSNGCSNIKRRGLIQFCDECHCSRSTCVSCFVWSTVAPLLDWGRAIGKQLPFNAGLADGLVIAGRGRSACAARGRPHLHQHPAMDRVIEAFR
jgi:hypothetical protein